ncbi:hypothetical protein C5167_036043 [Papaver somniferum]|nr:hypothetical protein C5167_036043 [Papaver somniferum]
MGLYRGLTVTVLRDAPGHSVYFWIYEYTREKLHPGCRKKEQETLKTMLVAGGLAGVDSWIACYPLDVVKSRLQAQTQTSVREEGYSVLWRGLGASIARAFMVNGAIFTAYEVSLRIFFSNNQTEENGLQSKMMFCLLVWESYEMEFCKIVLSCSFGNQPLSPIHIGEHVIDEG